MVDMKKIELIKGKYLNVSDNNINTLIDNSYKYMLIDSDIEEDEIDLTFDICRTLIIRFNSQSTLNVINNPRLVGDHHIIRTDISMEEAKERLYEIVDKIIEYINKPRRFKKDIYLYSIRVDKNLDGNVSILVRFNSDKSDTVVNF